jgi:hypothetical protein
MYIYIFNQSVSYILVWFPHIPKYPGMVIVASRESQEAPLQLLVGRPLLGADMAAGSRAMCFFPHRFTQTWMGNTWKKHGETLWLLITNDYYMLLLENHQDLLFCWVWTLDPFISNVVLIYVQRTMTGSSELIRTDLSVFKETNLSGNVSTSYSIVRFLDLLRDLSRVL